MRRLAKLMLHFLNVGILEDFRIFEGTDYDHLAY